MEEDLIRLPGFTDIHIHGYGGFDTSDGDPGGLISMARGLRGCGVSSFLPTTMTIPGDDICRAFEAVLKAKDIAAEDPDCANILGIRLEGPFLNPARAGVQDSSCCVLPSDGFELVDDLEERFPGLLKVIDISPELEGADEFIKMYSSRYVLSLAHTAANMDTAARAFSLGASGVTHMLNAMEPCLKRSPGVPGAAFEASGVMCEIICDGHHIDPVVLKMLFNSYGAERLIGISDSMRGAGMPDGIYRLGSVDVEVSGGRTFYGQGRGLAGSVSDLAAEAKILYHLGISLEDIAKVMSSNPLRHLGLETTVSPGTALYDRDMNFVRFA